MKWIASSAFGLEGMTGKDLKRLGAENVNVMNVGGAAFEGDAETAFKAAYFRGTRPWKPLNMKVLTSMESTISTMS